MNKAELRKLAESVSHGVQVTKCKENDSKKITQKQWAHIVREPKKVSLDTIADENALFNERHFVTGHNGVEHCKNGLGEWLY